MKPTVELLKKFNLDVNLINSGCCGIAGSFGYEKEHANFSMKIGNLKLFSAIRKADDKSLILANGVSCRTQIKDGTGRTAEHMAEILFEQFRLQSQVYVDLPLSGETALAIIELKAIETSVLDNPSFCNWSGSSI